MTAKVFVNNVVLPGTDLDNLVSQMVSTCVSTKRPVNPFVGQTIHELDTGNRMIWTSESLGWTKPWNQPWGIASFKEEVLTKDPIHYTAGTWTEFLRTDTYQALKNRVYTISVTINSVYHFKYPAGGDNVNALLVEFYTPLGGGTLISRQHYHRSGWIANSQLAGTSFSETYTHTTVNDPSCYARFLMNVANWTGDTDPFLTKSNTTTLGDEWLGMSYSISVYDEGSIGPPT
jgi:hypothetical protein